MRKFLLSLMVVFAASGAFAQSKPGFEVGNMPTRSYKIAFGPIVGLNYSMLSGNPGNIDLGTSGGMGFHGGLAANVHFGRKGGTGKGGTGIFGLQLEALYSQHSIKTKGSDDLKMSFIEIPLLAQFYVAKGLSLEAGPTFALNTSRSPDLLSYNNQCGFITKDLKANDVRLTVGARYALDCGLNFGARYNFGTSDIAGNMPCKLRGLQVSVGWMFTIVK